MSNVSKTTRAMQLRIGAAVCAVMACLSGAALAQTAPAYSEVPDPSTAPLAAESPENFVGEGNTGAAPLTADEVIRMLQDGNEGKPLTIAQLAAINDAMKRMEYVAEMRRKMGESQGGGTAGFSGGSNPPGMNAGQGAVAPAAINTMATGGQPVVLRISGSGGNYQALVSNGQQQIVLREGDELGSSKVTSIRISGVRVTSSSGNTTVLPFANPFGVGVTSSSR